LLSLGIESRGGQLLSNTNTYTPTSSDVSGIRVSCTDKDHPYWRPQARALVIATVCKFSGYQTKVYAIQSQYSLIKYYVEYIEHI